MVLEKSQFPITIQAYELTGTKEIFIAEQVVNSQADIDTFSARYAGKLIKAKTLAATGNTAILHNKNKKSNSGITLFIVILIILAILIAIGFYTGWIQRTFGIKV